MHISIINLFQSSISTLRIPESIDIVEAVTDNPLSYRSSEPADSY